MGVGVPLEYRCRRRRRVLTSPTRSFPIAAYQPSVFFPPRFFVFSYDLFHLLIPLVNKIIYLVKIFNPRPESVRMTQEQTLLWVASKFFHAHPRVPVNDVIRLVKHPEIREVIHELRLSLKLLFESLGT